VKGILSCLFVWVLAVFSTRGIRVLASDCSVALFFFVGQEVVRFCCSHEFRISEGFGILNWDAVILISTPTIRLDHKCVCVLRVHLLP